MKKKPWRRHPQPSLPRGPKLEEILEQINTLREEEKYEEILTLVERAPLHLQRRPELMVARGMALLALDDPRTAREVLEAAARQAANYPPVHAVLALAYNALDMIGHEIRSLRMALRNPEALSPEIVADLQSFYQNATEILQHAAAEIGVSPQEAEDLLYLLETGQDAFYNEDFGATVRIAREAQRRVPGWWLPYALELDALWYDGRMDEILRRGTPLVERFPDSPGILAPLVYAAFFSGRRDLAEQYAEPLKGRRYEEAGVLDKVVLALGLLEDDESLLRLYELHRGLLGECGHSTLHILAAAAANLRRWGIAQRIWRILDRRDWGEGLTLPSVMFPQSRAVNLRKPAPGRNSRYSTRMVVSLMSPRALREALEVISMVESKTFSRGQIRRRVQQIAKQNPLFFHHLEFLFLEDSEYDLWAELLLLLEKPEADELVFRVARGQQGTMTERLEILSLLAKHGRIPPDQTVEVWDETRGEWRTLRVPYWEIEPLPPETERIIVQVLSQTEDLVEQGKWKEVQREVEEALAAHPNMPELYFLLGEAYLNQGYQLKALGAYQRALELDPQSPLARCSIAILHLRENDTEAARRMLEPLGRVRMHPREYIHWLEAMALLHFLEHDYGLAQFYVNRALEEDPDNQILRQIQWMIEIQLGEGIQRYAQERKERVAQRRRRPILADASLAECLDRISRESLQATARAMPTPVSYGGVRKSELIQRLTRVLTDPYWLERIVRGLSAQEQDALWDVLKAGGVMAWELFTERYGDDLGESPDWEYHEPETVMGRLRMLGLLSDGTWEGQYVVLVPKDLRELLPPLLER